MRLERRRPLDMVRRDNPCAIRLALHATLGFTHGLQPADMGFSKALGRGWIMTQMQVDGIAPAMGGCDFGNRPVDGPCLGRFRFDPDHCAGRDRLHRFAFADIDIMAAPIDPVDNQIMSVIQLL